MSSILSDAGLISTDTDTIVTVRSTEYFDAEAINKLATAATDTMFGRVNVINLMYDLLLYILTFPFYKIYNVHDERKFIGIVNAWFIVILNIYNIYLYIYCHLLV